MPLDGPIDFRLKQFGFSRFLLEKTVTRQLVDLIDQPKLGKATTRHLLFGVK